jgi:nitrate/nitrite-specific signal transduction histidine kinase
MRLLRGNLRNKIIAWSFVPTAIILVAVALVSLYAYQRVTEELVVERDRELTRLSARLLATELSSYTDPLADQFLAIFDGVIVFDGEGNVLAAEPMKYEVRKPTWFKDLSLQRMFRSDQPIFSDVVVDRLRGEKLIVVTMPIAGQEEEAAGGIAGFFRLDATADSALARSIEKLRRKESNCVYLVDGGGQVIYHSNPEYVGEDFSSQTVVELVLDGWAGAHRTHDLEGQDIVASFAPVPGTPWGLVMEESWATLTQSSRRFGEFLLLLLALGVIVPAVIVTIGVRRITQPIAQLIRAAQEIAGGHFGRRIHASTGDELEKLAEQFNRMASQLQESYTHLEQKVASRTKELATLNAIAAQVSHSLDLELILNSALDKVLDAMGMDTGQAFRLDVEHETLVPIAHRGLSEEFVRRTARLPLSASFISEVAETGQPIVRTLSDYPETELRELLEDEGLHLLIGIPLIAQGRIVGAINLGSRTMRPITSEELTLLAAIGQQIGVAVENARLYEQAQQLAIVKERNRLARDLHDSVTQALYGVTLYAEAATRQLQSADTGMVVEHLAEIRSTAQESLREMRLLIFELRLPMLKTEGLVAALQARLEAVEARSGLGTDLTVEGDGQLSAEAEEGLYRIAQEALNNVLKHAQASSVSVRLHQNDRTVTLEIEDDGIGFEPSAAREQGGFGLRGMEERTARLGGELTVLSRPGAGTCIRVEVCQ